MADLHGAVPLGDGIPILGQPAAPEPQLPVDEVGSVFATDVEMSSGVFTKDGQHLAALSLKFCCPPIGWMPPIVLIVPEEGLLALPDLLRKTIRDARRAAEDKATAAAEEEG